MDTMDPRATESTNTTPYYIAEKPPPGSGKIPSFKTWPKPELKALPKARKLKTTGNKADLVMYLQADESMRVRHEGLRQTLRDKRQGRIREMEATGIVLLEPEEVFESRGNLTMWA